MNIWRNFFGRFGGHSVPRQEFVPRIEVNLKTLIARLNGTCRLSLENAAGLCHSKKHFNIELEHWLAELHKVADSDLGPVYRRYGLDRNVLAADLTASMNLLKTGNDGAPSISPHIVEAIKLGWLVASINFGAGRVRSGLLLIAMLADPYFNERLRQISNEFVKIEADELRWNFAEIVRSSRENSESKPLEQVLSGVGSVFLSTINGLDYHETTSVLEPRFQDAKIEDGRLLAFQEIDERLESAFAELRTQLAERFAASVREAPFNPAIAAEVRDRVYALGITALETALQSRRQWLFDPQE